MKNNDGKKDIYKKIVNFFKNAETCVDTASDGIVII